MTMKGKVVLVTGGSSGIGRGCVSHFAAEGCYIAAVGRNGKALEEVAVDCVAKGVPQDKVLTVIADLSKDENCQRVMDETMKHFGRLDILVNSAGIVVNGSTESISMDDYDKQMDITRSVILLTKLALPHLLESKGSIVNVSSVTGLRAFPNVVAYNMSKAALDMFTKTLALEVASRGVRVNSVNPGVIITEVHKRGGMDDETYAKFLEHSKTTHAMGRVGNVDEVAAAVVFLASDKASFTTGITMAIDGGRSQMCPR